MPVASPANYPRAREKSFEAQNVEGTAAAILSNLEPDSAVGKPTVCVRSSGLIPLRLVLKLAVSSQ